VSAGTGLLKDATDEWPFSSRVEVVSASAERGVKRRLAKAHEWADGAYQHVALANQCADAGWLLNVGDR
jgi:hypothetical protein